MAITFNAMILIRTIKSIKSAETGSMLMTQVLVSLISIGDLLIGVYLVVCMTALSTGMNIAVHKLGGYLAPLAPF